MTRNRASLFLLVVLGMWLLPGSTLVVADQSDLSGVWYGYGYVPGLGYGTIRLTFVDFGSGLLAETHVPALGLLDTLLPAMVEEDPTGTTVTGAGPTPRNAPPSLWPASSPSCCITSGRRQRSTNRSITSTRSTTGRRDR